MAKKKTGLKLKPLHYEALEMSELAPDMATIMKRDVTPLLIEEIRLKGS